MWSGTERAEEEYRERWRQVSGPKQGWAAQEETQAQPHHLHHLPAARAGACLWKVPLPRRVQPRGARHEGEPPRSQSSGNVNCIKGNTISEIAKKHFKRFCLVFGVFLEIFSLFWNKISYSHYVKGCIHPKNSPSVVEYIRVYFPTQNEKLHHIYTYLIFLSFSSRSGFRTAELNGAGRKKWTPAPWSSTIHPCSLSTVRHRFTPAWVQWPTPSPWNPGWPLPCPVLHLCTVSQASWVQLKASSPATQATISSTPPPTLLTVLTVLIHTLTLTLIPIRPWVKGCRAWLLLLISVQHHTLKSTLWRMWTSAAPVLLRWGWKPRNTSSLWTRPGNPCD